jgi:hypothetical protein
MADERIGKGNVGRVAERIVANELEYRGFWVSDLNKDRIAANADLLAVKDGRAWQIQVKGASYEAKFADGWWFNYGYCNEEIIGNRNLRIFNRTDGFYWASVVALVCVKSPSEYHCAVLPVEAAEAAAQMNLDYAFRTKKKDNPPKKPGKMWVAYSYLPTKTRIPEKRGSMERELDFIKPFFDNWEIEKIPNGLPVIR